MTSCGRDGVLTAPENGARGNGTIPLLAAFVGKQVFQKDVGAVPVGDFNNSLSSGRAYVERKFEAKCDYF